MRSGAASLTPTIIIWLLILGPPLAAAPVYPLDLQNSRPHSTESYTQGFFFLDHDLYESAGLYGRSSLTRWSFGADAPARILKRRELAKNYFAEGAAAAEGEIYLLTWREQKCLVLDPKTLMIKREAAYSGEGWGLAWADGRLWRSDGSARLYPHRAGDFAPAGEALTVRDDGRPIDRINELEWDPLTGLLLANIYGRDQVAAIDLTDGQVRFWLEAGPLRALALEGGLPHTPDPADTALNGLALEGGRLWLTGKFWPRLYQVAWPPAGVKPAEPQE